MVRVLVDLPGDRGLRRGLRANDSIVVDVGTFLHDLVGMTNDTRHQHMRGARSAALARPIWGAPRMRR